MNQEQLDVLDFHAKVLGDEYRPGPRVPGPETIELRLRLVTEEFGEFVSAMLGMGEHETTDLVNFLHTVVGTRMKRYGTKSDIVGVADAIADLKYVLEGTNLAFGVDGEPVWSAVHRANMEKVNGPTDSFGKKMKPAGWKEPDIRALLEAQGL